MPCRMWTWAASKFRLKRLPKSLQERYRELGVVAWFLQLIGPARAVKLSGLRWALSSPVTPPRVEAPRGMTPVVLPESVQVV